MNSAIAKRISLKDAHKSRMPMKCLTKRLSIAASSLTEQILALNIKIIPQTFQKLHEKSQRPVIKDKHRTKS